MGGYHGGPNCELKTADGTGRAVTQIIELDGQGIESWRQQSLQQQTSSNRQKTPGSGNSENI